MAFCLANLGEIAIREEQYSQAERSIDESLALANKFGDKRLIAFNLVNRGRLENLRGRSPDAELALHEALRLNAELGARERSAEVLELLALTSLENGQTERAARLLGSAAALQPDVSTPGREVELAVAAETAMRVRRAIGPAEFEAALGEGGAMSLDEAVDYALQEAAEEAASTPL